MLADVAPRKPKNPIKDLSDLAGSWLGGNRGTMNPQVARVSRDLGTVAQTIDTFTGGLGSAAGRDIRNFQQGGSLPTNVAKATAVNLAAGAVGAKAAQVAAKGAGRIVGRLGSPRNNLKPGETFAYHSGTGPKPVHISEKDLKNFHSGTLASALDRQTNVQRFVHDIPDANLSRNAYQQDIKKSPSKPFFIDRYRIKLNKADNKQPYVDEAYAEIADNMDEDQSLEFLKQNPGNPVQNYDNIKIPSVKPYKNLVEDPNSTSFLIPKNRIGPVKDVKFSGRATMESGYLTNRIGQGGTPSEIIFHEAGSGFNSFATPKFINPKTKQIQSSIISATPSVARAAAFAAVATPKKKNIRGRRSK